MDQKTAAELKADQEYEAAIAHLSPTEQATQREVRESNRAWAKHVFKASDGTPYRQDPAIVAVREGRAKGNKATAHGFKGQDPDPLHHPEFIKAGAAQTIRDNLVNMVLKATPQKALFAGLRSKDKIDRMLARALGTWAVQPTQANANAALGCLTVFSDKCDEDEQQLMIEELAIVVEERQGLLWAAMLFLALHLSKLSCQSTAALNLCMLYPAEQSDLLAGPRFVSELAADKRLSNAQRAGMIAGALHLADSRTMSFLLNTWKLLPAEARQAAAITHPDTAHIPYIEFLLDALAWETNAGIYGALAGQLGRLASNGGSNSPFVRIERAFPCWEGEPKAEVFSKQQVAEEIHNRLIALKNSEKGESVMPIVIEAWEAAECPLEQEADESDKSPREDCEHRPFDEMARLAFGLFYNPSRPGEERLKDSLCGGLIFSVTQTKGREQAECLLAADASSNDAFAANVKASAEIASEFVGSQTFRKMYPPTGDFSSAAQTLSQALYNLFAQNHDETERDKGTAGLGFEAMSRGLVFGLVLWRDHPELARKIAAGMKA